MTFSGFREVQRAFGSPASAHEPTRAALDTLAALRAGVGFFGDRRVEAIDVAIRLLQEHGQAQKEDDRLMIVAALKELDDRRKLRLKVLIQIALSALVVGLALSVIIGWVQASDDLQKIAFGLVGTAVGFWLK